MRRRSDGADGGRRGCSTTDWVRSTGSCPSAQSSAGTGSDAGAHSGTWSPARTSPAPVPDGDMWHGSATTQDALWHASPGPVSGLFQIKWDRQTVTFGALTATVDAWEQTNGSLGIFARPNGLNLQIVFDTTTGAGSWTLAGEPGQASGTLVVEH